jgi:hypothetical protein
LVARGGGGVRVKKGREGERERERERDVLDLELVLHACDADNLDVEPEDRVGGDRAAHRTGTVSKLRGDGELELLADAAADETLVPSLDDYERERERERERDV